MVKVSIKTLVIGGAAYCGGIGGFYLYYRKQLQGVAEGGNATPAGEAPVAPSAVRSFTRGLHCASQLSRTSVLQAARLDKNTHTQTWSKLHAAKFQS